MRENVKDFGNLMKIMKIQKSLYKLNKENDQRNAQKYKCLKV